MKNNFTWFLAILISFIFVIIGLWVTPVLEFPTGQLHPIFSTMLKSGSSVADGDTTKWLAYLFGLGIIGIFGAMIYVSTDIKNKTSRKKFRKLYAFCFFMYVLVYSLMVFSYWNYRAEGAGDFIMGFPKPTAWMMYGMWATPLILTLTYIFKFDEFVLTPEELEKFHKIVAARRAREKQADS